MASNENYHLGSLVHKPLRRYLSVFSILTQYGFISLKVGKIVIILNVIKIHDLILLD